MKKLLLTITLIATFNVSAATVTLGETTNPVLDTTFLDTNAGSHVDTTTGLEWLDFGDLVEGPMTFGHSLNSAEAAYGADNGGWRLATYTEVYALFDRFFEPPFEADANGKMSFGDDGSGTTQLIQSRNSWLFAFGTDAEVTAGGVISEDVSTLFSYGLFLDENNQIGLLGLKIDTNPLLTTLYGPEFSGITGWDEDTAYTNMGVFMVRDYTVVPIPAAVWLFGTGLIGLVAVARRKA